MRFLYIFGGSGLLCGGAAAWLLRGIGLLLLATADQTVATMLTHNDPITSKDDPITSKDDPITPKDDPITSKDNPITSTNNFFLTSFLIQA